MRTMVLPVSGIIVPSIALLFVSLSSVFDIVHGRMVLFAVWGGSFLSGLIIGSKFVQKMGIKYDRASRKVTIPGSYLYMVIYLVIFGIRYYFGFRQATDPGSIDGIYTSGVMTALSGVCTGMLGGFVVFCFGKRNNA